MEQIEELCESFVELDMESKYYQMVPYDSDDPDFTWHEGFSDTEDKSTGQSEHSVCHREDGNHNHKSERKGKFRGTETSVTKLHQEGVNVPPKTVFESVNIMTLKDGSNTVTHSDESKCIQWQQPHSRAVKLETSDGDTEDSGKEIVRRHRQLTSASSSYDFEKGDTNYVSYPDNWKFVRNTKTIPNTYTEFTQIYPTPAYDLSTVPNANTGNIQNFPMTTYRSPIGPSLNAGISANSPVSDQSSPALPILNPAVTSNCQIPTYSSLTMEQQPSCHGGDFNVTYPLQSYPLTVPNLNRTFTPFLPKPAPRPISDSLASEEESCGYDFKVPRKKFKKRPRMDKRSGEYCEIMPCYKNYQLLGDSQLLRFSEQVLDFKPVVTSAEGTASRRLGYCVSGQKIGDLEQRILRKELKLSDKLIILIGTNDMVYDTELKSMCDSFHSLLNYLKENAQRIVVLTVPPVPKLVDSCNHMSKLKKFNQFLISCTDEKKVFVIDLASLYVSYSNTISVQFFEPKLGKSSSHSKTDLIHLNLAGFKLLKAILDIEYFDRFCSSYRQK